MNCISRCMLRSIWGEITDRNVVVWSRNELVVLEHRIEKVLLSGKKQTRCKIAENVNILTEIAKYFRLKSLTWRFPDRSVCFYFPDFDRWRKERWRFLGCQYLCRGCSSLCLSRALMSSFFIIISLMVYFRLNSCILASLQLYRVTNIG